MNPNPSDGLHDTAALVASALTTARQITDELVHIRTLLAALIVVHTPDAELAELWSVVAAKRGCRRG